MLACVLVCVWLFVGLFVGSFAIAFCLFVRFMSGCLFERLVVYGCVLFACVLFLCGLVCMRVSVYLRVCARLV